MAGRPKNVTTLTPEPGRRVGRGLKHGLYTDRVIVLGESRADFDGLRVGLVDSLKPVGAYEHALVDKAAFCLWRNVRLARAEWAAAEKALLPDNLARDAGFVDQNAAAAVDWTERKPAPGDGERAAAVVAEIDAAPDDCEPLEYFPKHAPTLWAALCAEARGDAPAVVSSYVYREYGGWETLLESWTLTLTEIAPPLLTKTDPPKFGGIAIG